MMGLFGLLAVYAMVALWRHSTAIEPIRS
jgi:hypothetical protein